MPRIFKSLPGGRSGDVARARVAVAPAAIGGEERLTSLAADFHDVHFEALSGDRPDRIDPSLDMLIVGANAAASDEIDDVLAWLGKVGRSTRIAVILRNADVTTTRRLMRAGAADVLPAPVTDPALALCVERLLMATPADAGGARNAGEIVAVLKAGGGVGATAICVQAAILLAQRVSGEVCVADLDLQFGTAELYLDLPESITLMDCLSSGSGLAEMPYASALSAHRSRVRLLAAPREITPLEYINRDQADALVRGLRRDFALTLIDLPNVWTSWTNQIVQEADRIVLVTHLSVPHIQLVRRQLQMLASQRLEAKPLVLVCNAMTPEQTRAISLKSAEKALGRPFDVIIPEDRRVMEAALNQGIELAQARRGTKLEKALGDLAGRLHLGVDAARGGRP